LAQVFLPALLQPAAGGRSLIEIEARTVREVLDRLILTYPDLRNQLLDGDGNLRTHLAIAVDGEIAATGLREELTGNPEIHFVMAIKGGTKRVI
jgi:predicted phage tail protein